MNLAHISTYWTSTNPILDLGSYGLEVDTNQYKLGDGLTNWNDLTYYKSPFEWVVANGTDTYTSDFGKSWYELNEFIGYYEGLTVNVIFANANTGTCSLNLSSYGAKTIKKNVSTNLSAGDIIAGGAYQLIYDGTNWQIQGLGGGGGSVYTVNNGLTEDVPNHFQLGGQLVKITSIGTTGDPSYYLEILGDATNYSPTGILWVHGAQYGIYGEGSSVGIAGESTSVPLWSINKATGRNNIVDGLIMNRAVPLALTGMGVQTHINLSDSAGTTKSTALIITKWTTATAGAETAQHELWLRNAGATEWQVHTVKGTGQLQLNKYGVNTFAGTPTYAIGVDASGNVVEYAVSSGGSGLPIATAAGTVDVITATYSPVLVLADKLMCAFVATGANTSTAPTFNADGTGAKTIVKQGGQALVAGDIPNALAVCILEYNLANTRWELLNPVYANKLVLIDQAVPSNPPANNIFLFSKDQNGLSVPHILDENGNEIEITRDNLTIVRNTSGASIAKGSVVYITGATGSVPNVSKAKADSSTTLPAYGIMYQTTANNGFGWMMIIGVLEKFDLSAFAVGDLLYVSPTTAGILTATKPISPNFAQSIGVVLHNGVGNGVLQVFTRVVERVTTQTAGTNDTTPASTAFVQTAVAGVSGDVVGPAGATADDIAVFNGTTGKLIKDGGKKISDLELLANKDATGGYVGLTLFKINFKNVLNTFISFFTNSNTAARTYTFQDRNGTIADDTDLGLKAPLISPTFATSINGSYLTASEILITDGSKNVVSAPVATYPSLAELAFVKGSSSNIQTQINAITAASIEDVTIKAYQALGSAIKAQTVGQSIARITSTGVLINQLISFVAVYLNTSQTLTGVKWWQGTLGNYTANNENRIGLYSYSGGTLTLVASCANDGTLWQTAASATLGSKAFSSTYAAAAGIYFVALLWNRSAVVTAPAVGFCGNITNANIQALDFTNSAKIWGYKTGVTALPATQAMSGLTVDVGSFWIAVY